jgi:plasmid stability protein
MAKTIQIRNVPEDLHRRLRVRAAAEGVSLSEYLLRELEEVADRPSLREVYERARARGAGVPNADIVAAVREVRGPLPRR